MGNSSHCRKSAVKKSHLRGVTATMNYKRAKKKKDDEKVFICQACNGAHRAHHPKCPKSREFKQAQLEKNQGQLRNFFSLPSKNSEIKISKQSKPPHSTNTSKELSQGEPSVQKKASSSQKVKNPYLKKLLPTSQCESVSPNVARKPPPTLPYSKECNNRPSLHQASTTPPTPKQPFHLTAELESNSQPHLSAMLKKVVQSKMMSIKGQSVNKSSKGSFNCPPQIHAVIHLLLRMVPRNIESLANSRAIKVKEKMNKWRQLIPVNQCSFTIPPDSSVINPDPNYEYISGTTLYFLHWELVNPEMVGKLRCPNCKIGKLKRNQWDFSKNDKCLPVFCTSKPIGYAVGMNYKCLNSNCNTTVSGGDGNIISQLPYYISSSYPVDARYTNNNFHLTDSASFFLQENLRYYGSGNYISRYLLQYQAEIHMKKMRVYYEKINAAIKYSPIQNANFQNMISFTDSLLQYSLFHIYPTGRQLRDLYVSAARSDLTAYGFSDHERNVREIQSVGCNLHLAADHTFEPLKNYDSSTRSHAAAVIDFVNEKGQIPFVALVPSTQGKDFFHGAKMMMKRNNFINNPYITNDTWPKGEDIFKKIIPDLQGGRLGLFHFIARISKTLRDSHIDFPSAMHELRMACYHYHPQDLNNVINCLKDGSISKGKKYTDEEIAELQLKKEWTANYSKYLRKSTHPAESIRQKLVDFKVKYKVTASKGKVKGRGRLDPKSGKTLFTFKTHDAIENGIKNAQYITDIIPMKDKYRVVQPSKQQKSNLPTYRAQFGESKLEAFHPILANMANSGSSRELVDDLCLAGTSYYNRCITEKIKIDEMTSE